MDARTGIRAAGAAWAAAGIWIATCAAVPAGRSAATAPSASPAGAAGRSVAVTVYNQDLGLVREERTVTMKPGRSELRYSDVAAQLDPTSVHFVPAGGGDFRVLEQNCSSARSRARCAWSARTAP
jgi:hypothetical protein